MSKEINYLTHPANEGVSFRARLLQRDLAAETTTTKRLRKEIGRLKGAIKFAQDEGFEWPFDPFAPTSDSAQNIGDND